MNLVLDNVGKGIHVVKSVVTFNGQLVVEYEKPGEKGKKGGNTGKGGIGGKGGKHGNLKLLIKNQLIEINVNDNILFTLIRQNGSNGNNGKNGTPGEGGKHGKRYYGKYVNEMIFPGLRNEKPIDTESVATTTTSSMALLVAVKTATKVLTNSAKIGTSMAMGIGVQAVVSGVSAYASSGWEVKPTYLSTLIDGSEYAENGK